MALFYHPGITTQTRTAFLSEEESKHCIRVLRMVNGQSLTLVNGLGDSFDVKIIVDNIVSIIGLFVLIFENIEMRTASLNVL